MKRNWTIVRGLAAAAGLALGACASQRNADYATAIGGERPPEDFWLSVTVLRAPADTASRAAAYLRMPVAMRPARYVVEADRILRVAVGSGANDDTFPPETRQLTADEFGALWSTLRGSSLVSEDHPSMIGAAPAGASVGPGTVYVISFSAGGDRRMLAIEAGADAAKDAGALVEQLAGLAWMR